MNFFQKIQQYPKSTRKIIFWIIIIIIGIVFLFALISSLQKRLETVNNNQLLENLKIPELEKKLDEVEMIEVPEFPELTEEEIKQLEEELKALEKENQ